MRHATDIAEVDEKQELEKAHTQAQIWSVYMNTQDSGIEDDALSKLLEKANPEERDMVGKIAQPDRHPKTRAKLDQVNR